MPVLEERQPRDIRGRKSQINGKRKEWHEGENNLSQTGKLERYRAIQKLYFDLDLVIKMYTRGISSLPP